MCIRMGGLRFGGILMNKRVKKTFRHLAQVSFLLNYLWSCGLKNVYENSHKRLERSKGTVV